MNNIGSGSFFKFNKNINIITSSPNNINSQTIYFNNENLPNLATFNNHKIKNSLKNNNPSNRYINVNDTFNLQNNNKSKSISRLTEGDDSKLF